MNVSKEELVARAKTLAPMIAEHALETEKQRKPLDHIIKAIDEAGLFTCLVPKRWGGPELGLDAQYEIIETISSACMSTGWITAFYIGHHVFASRFSEQAQSEIFANGPRCLLPATTNAMMNANEVPGGWVLSGRGTWGSGIMHADWVLVGADTSDGRRVFMIPAGEVTYEDVWHVAGMAGTGSNDIIVNEVFVPRHRSELMEPYMAGQTEGARIHANPMYRMELMPFIYSEITGVFTGGLAGAQAAYAETVKKRVITHSEQATRERPHNHIQIGGSAASVMAARELAQGILRKSEDIMREQDHSLAKRLELKALTGFTVDHCRRSLNDMVNRAGSTNFFQWAALQRYFRDLNMVAIHAFWDWEVSYEQLGRHLVGLEPNNPLV